MDIENRIRRYIVEEIVLEDGHRNIDSSQPLISTGIVDSLSLLRLVMFMEEHFGVAVAPEEMIPEHFETIGAIKDFIAVKMGRP